MLLSTTGVGILTYLCILKLGLGSAIGERPLLLFGVLLLIVGCQLLIFGMIAELIIHRTEPLTGRGIVAEILGGCAGTREGKRKVAARPGAVALGRLPPQS